MAKKQEIKKSEARILLYISQVPNELKGISKIAAKLDIGYNYCLQILSVMVAKSWVMKHKYSKYMFYDLTPKAPLGEARMILSVRDYQDTQKKIQQTLKQNIDEGVKK